MIALNRIALALVLAFASSIPVTARTQSLLDRPPNVSGNWTGSTGTLYFNFVHRFSTSDAPQRKVSNVPTFLVAAGLPQRLLAGFNYSTNSSLAPGFPNEWELFARWAALSQDAGAPLDLAAQVGYNNASDGGDAEVAVARRLGISRVIFAGRALADPFEEGNVRFALAGGATVRLGQYLALAGDVASLTDRDSSERVAWSAGLHIALPLTPHTLSLHMTNIAVSTLQGVSRGTPDVRFGFEFTIPLTLRRYFGGRTQTTAVETPPDSTAADLVQAEDTSAALAPRDTVRAPVAVAPPAAPPRPATSPPPVRRDTTATTPAPARTARPPRSTTPPRTSTGGAAPRTGTARPAAPRPAAPRQAARVVKTSIRNLNFVQPRLQVTVGTTVEWTNNDPLPHTVTANNRSFDSGLIQPGRTYRRTFTRAGTYDYFCTPHPFMKGVVVVREQ